MDENKRTMHKDHRKNVSAAKKSIYPTGVFLNGTRFGARLYHNGKRHWLGYHATAELAGQAYQQKLKDLQDDTI